MKNYTKEEQVAFLERCLKSKLNWPLIAAALIQRWLVTLYHELMDSSDLKAWQTRDRQGNSCWKVRDCYKGKIYSFTTRQELMTWLETHYY